MWIIFPLILGVVQGLAEFLPISSSGHLALFQNFFGDGLAKYNDATAFTVLLHLGTLVAVFIVYRKDIAKMIPAFFTMMKKLCAPQKYKLADYTLEERLDLLVIIGTLPLVFLYILYILVGKIFDFELLDTLDNIISGQPIVIGVILIFNGLMLFFSDNLQGREKPMERFTLKNGLFVGICQMVSALLPGLSRSGSTITGSRLSGMSCPDAVRYSFLLSIPAILGSAVVKLPNMFSDSSLGAGDWAVFAGATVIACAVGLLSMKLLKYISVHSTFRSFSYYCFAVGGVAVVGGIIKLCI